VREREREIERGRGTGEGGRKGGRKGGGIALFFFLTNTEGIGQE